MKKLFHFVINKYTIAAGLFLVWILFFDQNDWYTQQARKQNLQNVKDNISFLNSEIARMEKEYQAMLYDPQKLEQFAREHYRMKRDNEDLYIIQEK